MALVDLSELPEVGNCDQSNCVARMVLDRISSKWGLLIIRQLMKGERRYSALRSAIEGVSEKMLAQTLRELERDGLISRTSYPVVPPHVVYALTPLGEGIAAHVAALLAFVEANIRSFARSQTEFDEQRAVVRTGS